MSQAGVIDGLQFARAVLEQRGFLGVEQLPRLAQMQCSTGSLEYNLRGGRSSNGKPCLRISIRGSTELICQRCLGPLLVPIAVNVELQLAESLREISEADDDRVLSSRHMEVILALPMVPRHEACAIRGPVE
ncbi:MAG: DUF177 domain-containing protein [Betaproteobacteria bacterium]|nr:MAG: DUF177 domain-containing protein [Betaproteobacteria bacterium]